MHKPVMLTGDRPTGRLHLGHYIGSLTQRVEMQNTHDAYIMIADVQALTDYFDRAGQLHQHIIDVAMDYLSVGIDPNKATILLQSHIPELTELTLYYLNLVTLSRLKRNPTVKTELAHKSFAQHATAGFVCYPVSQAADITAFQADIVPVGQDQLPMIEQTNEIVEKFCQTYQTDCIRPCRVHLSNHPRLLGIDGKQKASKSLGNAIFLSDDSETIKKKVFQMFTDPSHIRVQDPGRVEGHVVFHYLDAFHPDPDEIQSLKTQYQKGGLGDAMLKSLLDQTLQQKLKPIREKRLLLKESDIRDILFEGTKKARKIAQKTLHDVRHAMGIHFFDSH